MKTLGVDTLPQAVLLSRACAHATRLRLLGFLARDELAVNALAARLGLARGLVSNHLAVLRRANLVTSRRKGRLQIYRADHLQVQRILIASDPSVPLRGRGGIRAARRGQGKREGHPMPNLQEARTCYDHLAGLTGVYLLKEMLRLGWLVPTGRARTTRYELTARGTHRLVLRGVRVLRARAARRVFAYACHDWSTAGPHLGGALGASVLETLVRGGILSPWGLTRGIILREPLEAWLGDDRGWALARAGRARLRTGADAGEGSVERPRGRSG